MKCRKCGVEFAEGLFCPECGTKNDPNGVTEELIVDDNESEEEISDIGKAIEDVLFYYEQSRQKKEALRDSNQIYYNRAQRLLQRMIRQKSMDYRVWWEACKPIDFWEDTFSEELIEKYKVNEVYFAKALDYADIETKKKIIGEVDCYQERKRSILDEINRVKAERKAEEDRIAAEKRDKIRKEEEEQRKAEEIQRKKEAEKQRVRERVEEEIKEKRKLENEGKGMATAALIFGLFSLCTCGTFFFPEILGIVFALKGKKQGVMRGQAKVGLICSCISIVILIVVYISLMS